MDTLGNDHEGQTEEVFLAEALERATELGVKVASISLGYSDNEGRGGFNDGTPNHTWSEMNGHTTIAAKAVNMASSKGMLVCVSAGNEGTDNWHYITTPGDADSAFTIGAVDINGNAVSFSGYNFDTSTRVKPNVAALGYFASYVNQANSVSQGHGTSYSCPIIAGLSACLWQAFPAKTNWEVKTAIEQSASLYLNPSKHIGYGIPDFEKAYQLLSPSFVTSAQLENEFQIFPNPFSNSIVINHKGSSQIAAVSVSNSAGEVVYSQQAQPDNSISVNDLPHGMYVLQITTDKGVLIKKLIKD
jgi:subtilisin family serine protease